MGNIVKLVFQTFAESSGFDTLVNGGTKAQRVLNQLSGTARIVGRIFGPLGGIIGGALGAFLQGNIWQAAALGVNFLAEKFGWFGKEAQKATTYFDELKKSIDEFAAASEKAFQKAVGFQDSRQKEYQDEINSVLKLKKAELELARERERANGGTGAAHDAEIASLIQKAERDKAEDAVYRANERVRAAEERMAAAEKAKTDEDRYGPNTGKEGRLDTIFAEIKAAREVLAVEKEKRDIAIRSQQEIEAAQEASNLKIVNDKRKAEKEAADSFAEFLLQQRQKLEDDIAERQEEDDERAAKEREKLAEEEARKEKERRKKALHDDIEANRKRADDLGRRLEDATARANAAHDVLGNAANMDQAGGISENRREFMNNSRFANGAIDLIGSGKIRRGPNGEWVANGRLSNLNQAILDRLNADENKKKLEKENDKVVKKLDELKKAIEQMSTL